MNPLLTDRLKAQTADQHSRIESKLSIFSRIQSREDYARLLEHLWGYYSPKEASLKSLDWEKAAIDFSQRIKSPWLASDLKNLSRPTGALPVMQQVQPPKNLCEAMGALYVLEGATLGGQFIVRHLRAQNWSGEAIRFYTGYDEHTGEMWTQFRKAANVHCTQEEQMEDAVNGAMATFDEFARWFDSF